MNAARKRPSLGRGVAAALVLSASGAATFAALVPVLGTDAGLRWVVALLGLAYVIYVVGESGERVGRVTTLVVWSTAAVAAWFTGPPLAAYVLMHVGLVWLVRSLYFYAGVLPALVDLGLTALGVAFAAWAASRSHSAVLAFWCFFLVQAFYVLIPATLAGRGRMAPAAHADGFDRAHRAAEAAVRRLSTARR